MATILEYIDWRGDLSFSERPMNEVDNLILSELAYFDFEEALGKGASGTIREVYDAYCALKSPHDYSINNPISTLEACAGSERFGSVLAKDFVNIVDKDRQIQFAAVTFSLPGGGLYVAFRGTDNTIVGWREDCNISFMEATPAQTEAVKYLNRVLKFSKQAVTVGGHSKGGNLAVYAAAFCDGPKQLKIKAVYSNDGPGFNQHIAQREEYRRILPKVRLIIPESSMIGIIFSGDVEKQIIRSTAEGAMQHHPLTWMVERDQFVRADQQSSVSTVLDKTLRNWLDSLDFEQRKLFFSSIFDVLEASGAETLSQLNGNKLLFYNAIAKAAAAQDAEARSNFHETIRKLAIAGRDAIWDETKKRFEPLVVKAENNLLLK